MNISTYVDGETSLLEIAEILGLDIASCAEYARVLNKHGLIRE
jgi:aminopeptidase-like protein